MTDIHTYHRIIISGPPRTGKTSLAATLRETHYVRHTDEIASMAWSAQSEEACKWILDTWGSWVIEGAATSRALRKALRAYPHGRPASLVVRLERALVPRTREQERMAQGELTIWREVEPLLVANGVPIVYLSRASDE